MLVDEQHVLLEARVQVRLETELSDDRVVVAVDVGVYAIHTLEDLADERGERLWERNTCKNSQREEAQAISSTGISIIPILLGRTCSLSMLAWTQVMSCSMYAGAGILVGLL